MLGAKDDVRSYRMSREYQTRRAFSRVASVFRKHLHLTFTRDNLVDALSPVHDYRPADNRGVTASLFSSTEIRKTFKFQLIIEY